MIFSLLAFETIPFNGCSETVCVDFQTYEIYTIPFAILGLLFGGICLKHSIKTVNLKNLNSYSSKDVGKVDE